MSLVKNSIIASGAAFFLSACSLMPQPTRYLTEDVVKYDPKTEARVRFFVNGPTSFRAGQSCHKGWYEQDDKSINVSGGFLESWKYSSNSRTIGMPSSPRPWMRFEGLQFKAAIKEYIVKATEPITITMSEASQHWQCAPPPVSFIPENGKDYDVFMWTERNQCWVSVRQIDAEGSDIRPKVEKAPKCEIDSGASSS